jgi:hypothetical protein
MHAAAVAVTVAVAVAVAVAVVMVMVMTMVMTTMIAVVRRATVATALALTLVYSDSCAGVGAAPCISANSCAMAVPSGWFASSRASRAKSKDHCRCRHHDFSISS